MISSRTAGFVDFSRPEVWQRIADALTEHPPIPREPSGFYMNEPGWVWEPHPDDHVLWLVTAGEGGGHVSGHPQVKLRPGTLLWLRPGDTGQLHQDPERRLVVLAVHFIFDESHMLPERVISVRDVAVVSALLRRMVALLGESSPLSGVVARAVLIDLLAQVYRQAAIVEGHPPPERDPRLSRAIQIVQAQPGQRPALDDVAAAVGLGARRLSELFSRELGTTFREFVLETRLERACVLLTETPMSVDQVARALGYADHTLFSRQFRTRYGQPPSEFRASVH